MDVKFIVKNSHNLNSYEKKDRVKQLARQLENGGEGILYLNNDEIIVPVKSEEDIYNRGFKDGVEHVLNLLKPEYVDCNPGSDPLKYEKEGRK